MNANRAKPGPVPHGYRGTPIYSSWSNMIQRCTNPKNARYASYGARGISVCERWMDVLNFVADMGPRPEGKTLDRWPDTSGDYEPGNCRWATPQEQNRNTTRTILIEWRGESLCLPEWAERLGIVTATLRDRLERGLSVDDAFTGEVDRHWVTVVGRSATGETKTYLSVSRTRADGFNPIGVSACLCGRQRTHRGWTWVYGRATDEMLRIAGLPQELPADLIKREAERV